MHWPCWDMIVEAGINGSMRSAVWRCETNQATYQTSEGEHPAGQSVAATSTFISALSKPALRSHYLHVMSRQPCLVTSTTKELQDYRLPRVEEAYRPSIATWIVRLVRAGLATCISPPVLINNDSLKLSSVDHKYEQISGLPPMEQTNASTDTAPDPPPFETIRIPRSHRLLQARHRDTSVCAVVYI